MPFIARRHRVGIGEAPPLIRLHHVRQELLAL
jgi:hypothetical protein